jgi:DNA-binding CsgD family transcriptional regulator
VTALVGRLGELAEIDRFLDGSEANLHGLLLSGQAGIGKTTLWKAALGRAAERGFRVLACQPTEVETQLSFSALVDLFDDLADEILPELPDPQREALEAALMRTSADGQPAPLAISLGVLGMIRAAAGRGPLLIAVDDTPWLDESSARALEFALRRLEASPVGLLAAQRSEAGRTNIPGLAASISPARRFAIDVAPLSFDDTAAVVQRVLALELRRPTLVRIHELSGGNAFYALEVARAIQRRPGSDDRDELSIPDSLEALIRDRIDSMPDTGVEIALHAAALATPTRSVLAAALGVGPMELGFAAAVAAGVLGLDGGVIRFSHPLLAAAIYGRASPEKRRTVHRTLAAVAREPEERARHLALATDAPDAIVADALDEAARTARARGAAAAAAELAEAASRLTPDERLDERRRRTMAMADYHRAAGDVPRARATLETLAAQTSAADRAPILVLLGEVAMHTSDRSAARRAFEEALPLVGGDLALRARVEWGLAGVAFLTWTDWQVGDQHMTAALRSAEELGDNVLLLQVIGHCASWEFAMGRGVPRHLIERAADLERFRDGVPVIEHPDHQFATILSQVGEYEAARRLLDRLLADARRRGEWYSLPWLHLRMAWVELRAGNWDLSQKHVDECKTSASQSGQDPALGYIGMAEVELYALRGEVQHCRASVQHYLHVSDQMGLPHLPPGLGTSLGLLELSLGDAAAAYAHLEPFLELDFPGRAEPAILRPTVPLAIEALVGLGRLADAEVLLGSYEQLARQLDRTISIADSLHCRALLLAARLDLDAALPAAEEALGVFESLALPFETARTLLASGEIRRRARQKAAAREAVTRGLVIFEGLGAARWADRARSELARTGARRTPGSELTETEQRITELLAAGWTNREIADALFMSVHTVEAHLTRIYRMLGVRSRTELARRTFDRGKS